jgi:hypothetical protein
MPSRRFLAKSAAWLALLLGGCGDDATGPAADAAGQPQTTQSRVLEAGATALQSDAPPDSLDIYLVGFHPLKDDPEHQIEAHHFCRQVNEELMQCALYDGNTAKANLTGIEYIISERLFASLPAAEQGYWHPHNGEILSGQLVAPGLPDVAEKAMLRTKMNSYGKTWHTWNTGDGRDPGDRLPLGEPMLMWSFNRDGEIKPWLVERRDRMMGIQMGIQTAALRHARRDLAAMAHPQSGVDALKGKFPGPTLDIPGVVDVRQAEGVTAPF